MRCPACGGVLALLGKLGNLVWFRCTACGIDVHAEVSEVDIDDIDDDTVD